MYGGVGDEECGTEPSDLSRKSKASFTTRAEMKTQRLQNGT
jgi:hypothetical protein